MTSEEIKKDLNNVSFDLQMHIDYIYCYDEIVTCQLARDMFLNELIHSLTNCKHYIDRCADEIMKNEE